MKRGKKKTSSSFKAKKSRSVKAVKKKTTTSARKRSSAKKRIPKTIRQDYSRDTKPYYEPAFHAGMPFQPAQEVKQAAQAQAPAPVSTWDLPASYNKTMIALMVRDPYWAYTYWDISGETNNWIGTIRQETHGTARPVLRVYDVTDIEFNGFNAHSYYDIECYLEAKNWYLDLGAPSRSFIVDLGLLDENGKFYLIARSNVVQTPLDGPSDIIDEEWMAHDFEEIYALSGGLGIGLSSGEMKLRGKRLIKEWLSSGGISSPGFILKQPGSEKEKSFQLSSEIVLYGRAPLDGRVTIGGKPVPIRKDGTFSVRYSLPDGSQSIPVKFQMPKQGESKEAILEVRKENK